VKVISLQAENFKRLKAISITPSPGKGLVQITGRNAQGKSSTLDALWTVLAGANVAPRDPVRHDTNKARIVVKLGDQDVDLVVTRTFTAGGTELKVETPEGARIPKPQQLLDSLVGSLSFDPFEFTRMKPAEQFQQLAKFVPRVDFEAVRAANASDYARRAEVNRQANQLRAAAGLEAARTDEDVPEDVDVTDLMAKYQAAVDLNASIDRRAANRKNLETECAAKEAAGEAKVTRAAQLREEADALEREGQKLMDEAKAGYEKIRAAGALPAKQDLAAIRAQVEQAQDTNEANAQARAARGRKEQLIAQADALEAQSKKITETMAERTAKVQAEIAAAKMPVPGISFGEGEVLLNGVPFEQASDAEKLRASVAIAMSTNPKLRVLRIRDGSLLDDVSLALLEDMLQDNDFQCWIEQVDSTGSVGFVIEDGELKHAPNDAPQAPASAPAEAAPSQPPASTPPTAARKARSATKAPAAPPPQPAPAPTIDEGEEL